MQESQEKNDQQNLNTTEHSFFMAEDIKEGILPLYIKEEICDNTSSTAKALKIKLESITKESENYQVNYKSSYTIDELQIFDGPSLLKLFTLKEITKDDLIKYRCRILPGTCTRSCVGCNETEAREHMTAHLLNHVESLVSKAAKNPSLCKTKLFFPCQVYGIKKEPDSNACSSEGSSAKPFPLPQPDNDALNLLNYAKAPKDNLEKLSNAVGSNSCDRNVGLTNVRTINTRLSKRINDIREKNSAMNQERQQKVPNQLMHQPIVRTQLFKKLSKDTSASVEEDSSESGFSSSDNEKEVKVSLFKRKILSWNTRSLSASLRNRRKVKTIPVKKSTPKQNIAKTAKTMQVTPNKNETSSSASLEIISDKPNNEELMETSIPTKQETSPANKVVMPPNKRRYIPSILRRSTLKTSTVNSSAPSKHLRSDNTPTLTPSVSSETSVKLSPIFDPPAEKSSTTIRSHFKSSNKLNFDSSDEDSGSDSSCWSHNDEESTSGNIKHKSQRKQNLSENVKDEIDKQAILSAIRNTIHDHCYTNLKQFDKNVKCFVKLMTSSDLEQTQLRSVNVIQSRPPPSGDLYVLKGPSSKKIEPSDDPKVKAKALSLIRQLRHTKPKEVMICTERIVGNGQSDYIVQDFFTCEICGKRFTAPNSLYGHYRGHAGIKPFKCNICGRSFTRSHSLTYHSMIHTDTARFQCKTCGKKFRHPTHYKEHLNRHTGEEPYRCTDCPRSFKTRNTFRRHAITKHNKKITEMGAFPSNVRYLKTIYSSPSKRERTRRYDVTKLTI